ncbi:hypothetical protein BSQ98_24835 [Serratia liquefaciens]|uniref:hypothetical protein n=1 Tax=Serratia TaxID=613 RepID=UPI001020387F|nr:hypothetical protein [Serratia liquefaciens]RYM58222.1 hypothetical protein BSQ98_24835 [Serratia liquefaciens]
MPKTENEVNTNDFIENNIGLSATTSEQVVDGSIEQFRKNEISTPINIWKHNDECFLESITRRWLEISRSKRADNSFLRMQGKGSLLRDGFLSDAASMPGLTGGYFTSNLLFNFPNAFGSERDINKQVLKNQDSLRGIEFNKQEIYFIAKFIKQNFYFSHATNTNVESKNGDVNIYSRKVLQDKKSLSMSRIPLFKMLMG